MDDTISIVNKVTKLSLLIMSALLLGWVFYPEYRTVTMGMVLGIIGGWINTSYLSMKIRNLTQSIAKKERQFGIGFLTRLCISILIVMFSVKIEHFSLAATITGLFIPQVLTIPVAIYVSMTKNK